MRLVEASLMSGATRVCSERGSPTTTLSRRGKQRLLKRLGNFLDEDYALDRDAGLAVGVETATDHCVHGVVDHGVGSHDEAGIGAELQHCLARRRVSGDLVPDSCRTCEGHDRHAGVRHQRLPDLDSAGDQLYGFNRYAECREDFADEVDRPQSGQRGVGRRLEDDGASCGDGGGEFVAREQKRVVEAGDADDHAGWFPRPVADHALAQRLQVQGHRLSVGVGHFLGGGGPGCESARHLHPAVDQGLAGFQHQHLFQFGRRAARASCTASRTARLVPVLRPAIAVVALSAASRACWACSTPPTGESATTEPLNGKTTGALLAQGTQRSPTGRPSG